jgi:hypothetical protein
MEEMRRSGDVNEQAIGRVRRDERRLADLWRRQPTAGPGRHLSLEAPSMHEARMTAVARRLAPGVPFGEGLQLSAKMMTSLPPTLIGRMMSGAEAAELILQLVEGRRRPKR